MYFHVLYIRFLTNNCSIFCHLLEAVANIEQGRMTIAESGSNTLSSSWGYTKQCDFFKKQGST